MSNEVDEYRIRSLEDSQKRIEKQLEQISESLDSKFVRLERYMITERAVFAFISVVVIAAFGFIWRASGGG